MAAVPITTRMDQVEDHLKGQDALLKAQSEKLDLIIRLTEAQDEKFKALSAKVDSMAPTVELGQKVVATANGLSWVGKRMLWAAAGVVAFLVYMSDRWHLVGQLFRRAG